MQEYTHMLRDSPPRYGSNVETVSVTALRRFVVAHQRYATRARRGNAAELERTVRRLQAVQLDSISTVERAHRITLGARIGAYPRGAESKLLRAGRLFEYWAHEACLLPIEDYPLFKRRMIHLRDHHWWGRPRDMQDIERLVVERIATEGALPSRAFEGKKTSNDMWAWKPAKRALEHLFAAGELCVSGRDGFQRVYDLPERVIPKALLEAPAPSDEEFRRGYALRAIEARGALTASGIVEHCRLRPGGLKELRPELAAVLAEGRIREVAVKDGGARVYVLADTEIDGDPRAAVLVCPFDSLLWDRPFVERIFGFDPRMEIYKRPAERIYGYYVLPLLLGDRLVGRADLKTNREEGTLELRAFHLEPGVKRTKRLETGLEAALLRLAAVAGAERLVL
ncbi:MAG: uncharacterized protein QOG85_2090 [Gaiellaceae bacterium]|nr:uncharacterized protein [Gaiellaceae bacterium]